VGQHFRLSKARQVTIINEVSQAVETWNQSAQNHGLKRSEIERMHAAFQGAG
tara:strand:+ start:465 stop:620 length:156 start_codon:yes stop_codon:yes gene_type:complete